MLMLYIVLPSLPNNDPIGSTQNNYEMVEYGNLLREGILEAYTGMAQGLKDGNNAALLNPYLEGIFGFLEAIHNDSEKSDGVVRGAVGLIGDLAEVFGTQLKPALAAEWVGQMLKQARSGRGTSMPTKEIAKWSSKVLLLLSCISLYPR